MEQHRDNTKILSATVPVSPDEGTLEDVAMVAWNRVKDQFDVWRSQVDTGVSIINKFFEVDDQGHLQFL